jgi:F-type H+-transporting ATPase subunit gamma
MSENLEFLERRITSISSVVPFLNAVRSIAEIGYRRANRALEPLERFKERLDSMLEPVASTMTVRGSWHALSELAEKRPLGLLVLGTQRGLCGPFNQRLITEAQIRAKEVRSEGRAVRLLVLGARCQRLMEARGTETIYSRAIGSLAEPDYETIEEITLDLIGLLQNAVIGEIVVVHNVAFQRFQYRPEATRLFPLELPELRASRSRLGEPPAYDPDALFTHVSTEQLLVSLYEMALKSAAAEQLARINAMRLASENAQRMVERLTQDMARARSERVTKSLLEVVSGFQLIEDQA